MATDMMALINQELAKIERNKRAYGGGSADPAMDAISEAWQLGLATKEENRKEKYYKDQELDGIGASLDSLVSVIDNNASLATAEAQLALYEKEAGSNAEHKINAMALREGISRKREAFGNYGVAIQEASDAFDGGEMSFKQEDYENLPDTFISANAKRKAEGLKEHGSIMDYMSSELTRAQRWKDNISPGLVQNQDGTFRTAFRYGKANNSDNATYNQLNKHIENLDIAMKALYGDDKITEAEAKALMLGSDGYEKVKLRASNDAKDQLNKFQSGYRRVGSLIEEVKLEAFSPSKEIKEQLQDFGMDQTDWYAFENANREGRIAILNKYKNAIYDDMEHQNEKYYNWTGTDLIKTDRRDEPEDVDDIINQHADITTPPDDSDQVSTDIAAPEPTQVDSTDYGVFQINDKTFAGYNPADMSQEEQIQFASKIVNNELSDPTVGSWNKNDGWNNWSVYKNETDDFKLARGKGDDWLVKNGLSQQQLDSIDENFDTNKDKKIARAVMYAESKGDHTAKYENITAAPGAKLSPEEFAKLSPSEQAKFTTSVKKPVKTMPVKTVTEKKETVSKLTDELYGAENRAGIRTGGVRGLLEEDRQKVVSYGTVFSNANVGFKKMLKNKKTTDKFKTKKGNIAKRLVKAKDRLASLELEEIRPQGDIEAIIDFFNPADQLKIHSAKTQIARLENQLNSYNSFEEFLKTYGDAESEYKRIRKEISSYYK